MDFPTGNTLFFAPLSKDAIVPTKRDEDGCYDLYACTDEPIIIPAHTVALVDTKISVAFSPEYRISIRERGSNTKSGLIVMAGQIDSGYRGSIFVALYNANDRDVYIGTDVTEVDRSYHAAIYVPYTKAIAQMAVEYVPKMKEVVIEYADLKSIESERGTGALGSSGK